MAASLALVVGAVAAFLTNWQAAVLLGWEAAAVTYLVWVWLAISRLDAEGTRRLAVREDSSRAAAELMLIGAAILSLVGVVIGLVKGSNLNGAERALMVTLGVLSIVSAWAVVQTVFTLRYAHLYYGGTPGGIDFNEDDPPRYLDFAYLAFTIGMTFQVSDTNLEHKDIRATALRHGLLSYVFGAIIIATAINVVAGLFK
ncbi:MAG: DUF1345 domain-containing protein [Actinobacteria bacterium]|nr:DUF1345 domain-containing protein [Actinomycetota bacterium]MBV8958466.1 DUF1345 domain-containing protein [Actinomycetota bacterium]MBV9254103.1 DUF1345 domain-containing protein [Actinomycetota bacterium]MBV9663194.1 DUF1345 domain-containing protein [Actinomycetota bacterium]MBV9936678.1 DUF1345 domain-containing protein [Actinomycetota bacterium]